ncbi:hypothetical protein ACP26L_01365 [Paenibacillus sp. S-38]|uniref:hypothetical protein n=1 Tax=Paenibacillus sp. S-38 TaxID=3416710 RepID=UPI003CEFE8A1
MSGEDAKVLSEQIVNVRLDIRELKTMMADIKDLKEKVDDVDDTAKEALSSTKSSHKRLDAIDRWLFWFGTSILGSVLLGGLGLWKTYKP